LGFIGHSFELGSPATSVGICFSIQDPTFKHDCIIQHDSIGLFSQAVNPQIKPEDTTQLQVTPKIVFIAACATQGAFLKLWNVDNTTKGRALVIPQINTETGVDLLWGATAYTAILNSLLQGNTLSAAVADGNKAAQDPSIGSRYTWQVIGDGNVRITKPHN
jgi:hypothetical protein